MIKVVIRFLNTLLRWRKFIFWYMLIVGVTVSILMLIVPKTYQSYALIQPVTATESTGILGVLSGLTGNASSSQGESGILLSILQSRSLLEAVVEEFDLMTIYDAEIREELVRSLREDYQVSMTDEGAIHFEFASHTDWFSNSDSELIVRKRSKEILDYVIGYLDEQNVFMKTQSARFQREFLENRYNSAMIVLDSLETVITTFQKKTSIVALTEQFAGKIQISTELKKQLLAIESELYVADRSLSPNNQQLKNLNLIRESILSQVAQAETQNRSAEAFELDQIFPPFALMPDLSIRYKHLEMELESHFLIIQYLGSQLEEAKLREAKDTPTIQIIDMPSLPELRSSPQRTITVLVTALIAFFAITFLIYGMEYFNQSGGKSGSRDEIDELKSTLRSIFSSTK